jgi:hypothetical protein
MPIRFLLEEDHAFSHSWFMVHEPRRETRESPRESQLPFSSSSVLRTGVFARRRQPASAARRSSPESHLALARALTAAVFRFNCLRCVWSGCRRPALPASATKATQPSRAPPVTRKPKSPITGLRRPRRRRGRRIVRNSAVTSPGAMSGSPIGQRGHMHIAVVKATPVGEKALCASRTAGPLSGLSGGPFKHPVSAEAGS